MKLNFKGQGEISTLAKYYFEKVKSIYCFFEIFDDITTWNKYENLNLYKFSYFKKILGKYKYDIFVKISYRGHK